MSSLVAIVGRPNVGKSTIFNRITRSRKVVVDDKPGVTRDRVYETTEWAGNHFILVDTGGYVPDSDNVIEKAVREQVSIAIQQAELILFVVDAQSGITPLDQEIASMLRKSRKSILVLVNKVDDESHESEINQFYSFGLGDPVPVSAQLGRNIGDMLDIVVSRIPPVTLSDDDKNDFLRIAIIGRPNVGKSSLVNALLGSDRSIVTDIPGTTRDSIDTILKYYGEEILLIDTAGLRKRSKVTEAIEFFSTVRTFRSIERCDIAVLVIDATQGIGHQDMTIISEALKRKKGLVLAVNKWDLIEKDTHTARIFENALHEHLKMNDFIPIIFISALEKKRIIKVIELAREVYKERNKRIPTSELNRVVQQAVRENVPPAVRGYEITIKYAAQVKQNPPVFAFFSNFPKYIPESYQRYLENRLRKEFGFKGVPLTLSFKRK
jgi:GTPase